MNHTLTIETDTNSNEHKVNGNRIVQIDYYTEGIIKITRQHSRICVFGNLIMHKEVKRGLTSKIVFKCNMCNREEFVYTEDPKKEKSIINVGAVWGTLAVGSTYKHLDDFLGVNNIPSMPNSLFYSIQDELSEVLTLFNNYEYFMLESLFYSYGVNHVAKTWRMLQQRKKKLR